MLASIQHLHNLKNHENFKPCILHVYISVVTNELLKHFHVSKTSQGWGLGVLHVHVH